MCRQRRTQSYVSSLALVLFGLLMSATAKADETASRFAVRGLLPWHNFLSGPTAWNEDDYRQYLDRMQQQRLNLLALHCYTGGAERYAPYVEPMIRIEYRDVVPLAGFDTSLTARWGYRPLAVADFAFQTAKCFALPPGAVAFGADCATLAADNEDAYRRAQQLIRRVLEMAHERGIQVAMGFEFGIHPPEFASIVPPDSRLPGTMLPDPTHPSSIEILHATIDNILSAYPGIDGIWLWLHEHTMYVGQTQAAGPFQKLLAEQGDLFGNSDQPDVRLTGVWSLEYIRRAHAYLQQRAPGVNLTICGWGGGAQLPPVLEGLDRVLPREITFACLNPGQGSESHPAVMARIAPHRPVLAIPWLEGDARLWHLQPSVASLRRQIERADQDGLHGTLAIHWRTEEMRSNQTAFARFAWDPRHMPTAGQFYQEDCAQHYGPLAAPDVAALLMQMDEQRWMDALLSPVYFPYDPTWGVVPEELRGRLSAAVTLLERLESKTTEHTHTDNLRWLADNLRFTLLLDRVSRGMEPAYRLKNDRLTGSVNRDEYSARRAAASDSLTQAPLEDLFQVFARRVRSRGELGELSSLNQRLWLQYRELQEMLEEDD